MDVRPPYLLIGIVLGIASLVLGIVNTMILAFILSFAWGILQLSRSFGWERFYGRVFDILLYSIASAFIALLTGVMVRLGLLLAVALLLFILIYILITRVKPG